MKTYPFSVQKHAHSIEFYRNHILNTISDAESGEIQMDREKLDNLYAFAHGPLEELYEAMFNSRDGKIVYLTGKQIGLAKKIVFWASERRASSLISAGKLDYLQYC